MSVKDSTPIEKRDQMVALTDAQLVKGVEAQRKIRAELTEKYGHIDRYRMIRDEAVGLQKNLSNIQRTTLLVVALDMLAQLPDLQLPTELAELDYETPEVTEEEK